MRPTRRRPPARAAVVLTALGLAAAPLLVGLGAAPATARATDTARPAGYTVGPQTTQLILGVAADWDAEEVVLHRFERRAGTARKASRPRWVEIGTPWLARLGRGLAWGRGEHSRDAVPSGVPVKREGDKRAPAGAFTVGPAYGYAIDVERHPSLPYLQVTANDLFVSDPRSPLYNQHLRLMHPPVTAWERAQAMIRSDPAHRLKLFIGHNPPPEASPGAGSAIFFHIWRRDGAGRSIGCTTMDEEKLRTLVRWVDPERRPLYVLLPASEYVARARAWGLPEVALPVPPPLALTPTGTRHV